MTATTSETRIGITGGTEPRRVTRSLGHGRPFTGAVAAVAGMVFLAGAAAGTGGGFALVLLAVAALVAGAASTALWLERSWDRADRDERAWMFGALCAPALPHGADGAGGGHDDAVDEVAAAPGVAVLASKAA